MAAGDLYATSKKKPQGGDLSGAASPDDTYTTNVGGGDLASYGGGAPSGGGQGGNLADAPRNPGPMAPQPAEQPTSTTNAPPSFDPRPPPTAPPAPAQPGAATPPDPFAASGGGTYFASTGQWVPNNNAAALAAAQAANGGVAGVGGGTTPPSVPGVPPAVPVAPVAPPTSPETPTAPTPEMPVAPLTPPPAPTSLPPPTPAAPDPNTAAYKSALLKMLDQASTPATLEDPALKAQSDAAAVGLTRNTERGRAALAERMAQQGGAGVDSGAFNNELAGLFNQQGEQQAGINAGLVGDANKQKVQQLQAALTMMGNDVNSEQGRALTKELAQAQLAEGAKEFEQNFGLEGKKLAETIRQFDTSTQAGKDALAQQLEMFKLSQAQQGKQFDVDAALKRMGIESQTALGQGDLALRDKLGTGGLNAQIMQMLLQNDQFGKSLGADLGKFNASQGSNYLSALLGQLGA